MDFNIYATEKIVAERLADLRAAGARVALIESARGVRPRRGPGRRGRPHPARPLAGPGEGSRRRMQGCGSPAEIVCLPPGRGGPGPWRG